MRLNDTINIYSRLVDENSSKRIHQALELHEEGLTQVLEPEMVIRSSDKFRKYKCKDIQGLASFHNATFIIYPSRFEGISIWQLSMAMILISLRPHFTMILDNLSIFEQWIWIHNWNSYIEAVSSR